MHPRSARAAPAGAACRPPALGRARAARWEPPAVRAASTGNVARPRGYGSAVFTCTAVAIPSSSESTSSVA